MFMLQETSLMPPEASSAFQMLLDNSRCFPDADDDDDDDDDDSVHSPGHLFLKNAWFFCLK